MLSLLGYVKNGTAGYVIDGVNYNYNGITPFAYTGKILHNHDNALTTKAYLNYLIFDRNFVQVDGGYVQMQGTTNKEDGTDVPHEQLYQQVQIKQAGYMYIWLSNESASPVEVYFDDFKVTQIKSPIVQMEDFYPFGLTFNSYQRENSLPNGFLYNGKEQINDLGQDWADYGARTYMPEIGRWGAVDPMCDLYRRWSPYNYALDNPIRYIDPNGAEVSDTGRGVLYTGDDAESLFSMIQMTMGSRKPPKDHEDREVTVTRSGNDGHSSHNVTETATSTVGNFQYDSEGHAQWKETTTTTTTQTNLDPNGNTVNSSQSTTVTENIFEVLPGTQLHFFGPNEYVTDLGKRLSSKTTSTTSSEITDPSWEFKTTVSMTSDYSRKTNGLSITQANTNWMMQNVSRNLNEGMYDYSSMAILAIPALFDSGNTQTFFKSCGKTILQCSLHSDYLKAISTGTAGYINTK